MPSYKGEVNRHHILHTRRYWSEYREGSAFRETRELIIPMPVVLHKHIHKVCPAVTPLELNALCKAYSSFEDIKPAYDPGKPLAGVDALLKCMQLLAKDKTASGDDHLRAELAHREIEMQRSILQPFFANDLEQALHMDKNDIQKSMAERAMEAISLAPKTSDLLREKADIEKSAAAQFTEN